MVQQTTVIPGRKKRSHHKKNIKGPKFRHPPEPVHPNVIFSGIGEGDKADMGRGFARLYRDMIRYSISSEYRNMQQKQKEQGESIGFKIKNIGYWLLDHNPDYIDYYSGSKSKTPDGRILDNIRQTLKNYLEHLQIWRIVKRLQEVDAETQNGTKTWLYGYGRVGLIIAWMFEYRDRDIVIQKPSKVNVDDVAKANTRKLCECPGSEPGKVKIGNDEHLPGCRFRKRSSRYATNTSVIPSKIVDGFSLGVVLGEENH